MSACQQTRTLIDDALDGRLGAAARAAFDAHVRQCAACAAEWEFAASLRSSLLKVGFDPAPAGLKESIAAGVRRIASSRATTKPSGAEAAGGGRFRMPPFFRAAAGILVVAAVGWLVFRQQSGTREGPPSQARPPAGELDAPMRSDVLVDKARTAPARITMEPAGGTWNAVALSQGVDAGLRAQAGARDADALRRVHTIAGAGLAAGEEFEGVTGPDASPEQRVRQAEFLVAFEENLDEITDAVGEDAALRQLASDADATLLAFSPQAEKKRDGEVAAKAEDQASPLKVTVAKKSAPPAFYLVSGPGVIARAENVLKERGVEFDPVWLKDRDPNRLKRTLEQQATDYRILEADVAGDVLDAVVGDLESLEGIRLLPVGRAGEGRPAGTETYAARAENPPPPRAPAPRGGRGAATGAPATGGGKADSAPSGLGEATRSNPLSPRRLRLVLIAR
jgi:Putative zinc-finger